MLYMALFDRGISRQRVLGLGRSIGKLSERIKLGDYLVCDGSNLRHYEGGDHALDYADKARRTVALVKFTLNLDAPRDRANALHLDSALL